MLANKEQNNELDLSIVIVHTFEKHLICQTLNSIARVAPKLNFEIIIIDNNPSAGFGEILRDRFPHIKHIPLQKNIGFGPAINVGIKASSGKYVLIFNPDIVALPNSLEELKSFMDDNPDIGMCGPKLCNPDGSLQYSCYRFPTPLIPVFRRTVLGKLGIGKTAVDYYLMKDFDHSNTTDVDSLIGAAIFARQDVLNEIGLFDERFFMYYEDNDLCRRFWEAGHRVVYHPKSTMIHYHRRASADGNLFRQLFNRFAWIQIVSAIKFFIKYRGKENPRTRVCSRIGGKNE